MQFRDNKQSLEKFLAKDGTDSVAKALAKAVKANHQQAITPPEVSLLPQDEVFKALLLKEATDSIAAHLKDFDIDSVDATLMAKLTYMPITTVEEIRLWKEAWLKVDVNAGKEEPW